MEEHLTANLPWMTQRLSGLRERMEPRAGRHRCGRPRRTSGWARRCESLVWSVGHGIGMRPDPEMLLQEG